MRPIPGWPVCLPEVQLTGVCIRRQRSTLIKIRVGSVLTGAKPTVLARKSAGDERAFSRYGCTPARPRRKGNALCASVLYLQTMICALEHIKRTFVMLLNEGIPSTFASFKGRDRSRTTPDPRFRYRSCIRPQSIACRRNRSLHFKRSLAQSGLLGGRHLRFDASPPALPNLARSSRMRFRQMDPVLELTCYKEIGQDGVWMAKMFVFIESGSAWVGGERGRLAFPRRDLSSRKVVVKAMIPGSADARERIPTEERTRGERIPTEDMTRGSGIPTAQILSKRRRSSRF
jgi:hypothetical protein